MNKENLFAGVNNEQNNVANSSGGVLKNAEAVWGKPYNSISELFETKTDVNSQSVKTYPHMLGRNEDLLKLVSYDNSVEMKQTDISSLIASGEIAISVKHHTPSPTGNKLDDLKLQCTHVQIVVGTDKGVFTVNNPRGYEGRLFGDPNYPMIFFKPNFPSYISEENKKSYTDNIRTWLVIANTFSQFPGDYDGGDPLTCIDKNRILEFGKMLLQAMLGNQSAKDWLAEDENRLYCAELAYVSLNLGIHFPLNEKTLGADYLDIKNAILGKQFLDNHENPYIYNVSLAMAPNSLDAVPVINCRELAVEPFCSADMIYHYIKNVIPRKELGEVVGAELQSKILKEISPLLPNFLRLETFDQKQMFDQLIKKILQVVSSVYPNYIDFNLALVPVLRELKEFSRKNGMLYVPPHCYLIRTLDNFNRNPNNGFFEWDYLGHGLHSSILKGG